MLTLAQCRTSGVEATISEELAEMVRETPGVFRLEVDGCPASEICPGACSARTLTFPVPARWYDGKTHVCTVFSGDDARPVGSAVLAFPLRKAARAAALACRMVNSMVLVDLPRTRRDLDVDVVCQAASFSRRLVRSPRDWRGSLPLFDIRDHVTAGAPAGIVIRDAASGLALEGGAVVVGTAGRPVVFGRIEAVDGPFVSGFVVRMPGQPRETRSLHLLRGKRTVATAAVNQFRADCLETWRAPWSGYAAMLPPSVEPGRISLVFDAAVLDTRRFSRLDRELSRQCALFVSGRVGPDPTDLPGAAGRFVSWMERHADRLRKKRRSLHEIAKGIVTLLAVTGQHDAAARLLARKSLLPVLACGDGRVLEGLRAVIDTAGPEHLPGLLEAFAGADEVARRFLTPRLRLRLAGGDDPEARIGLEEALHDEAVPMHLRLLAHETLIRYAP